MTFDAQREILVLIECNGEGTPTRQSLSALSFARDLSQMLGIPYALLGFIAEGAPIPALLRKLGATALLQCDPGEMSPPLAEVCAPTLAQVIRERQVTHVVAAATSFGKDVLPRLAGLLDAPYVSDCIGLLPGNERMRYLRPIHAGNFTVECETEGPHTLVSVRSSEFVAAEPIDVPACPVLAIPTAPRTRAVERVASLGYEWISSSRPTLGAAAIVVSGGRALSEQFFDVLGPLADCLGAALGATRSVCDDGHVPTDFQVGQTGKIVAPRLYVAVGISGTVQHLAGMRTSQTIVAINLDPNAPIFSVADYGLVGDLFEVVPALTRAIQRIQGQSA